jgi:hypothetical protein
VVTVGKSKEERRRGGEEDREAVSFVLSSYHPIVLHVSEQASVGDPKGVPAR